MLRSDVLTAVRDMIYEASGATGAIWTDAILNRFFTREMAALGSNNIYLENIYTTTTVVDQYDYTLPTGTIKGELVERNDGTSTDPLWTTLNGVDNYSGAIWLPYKPSSVDTLRIHIRKDYTDPADDTTTLDIPAGPVDVVIHGMAIRCYKRLIGFLTNDKSWDSVTKPTDMSLPTVLGLLRDSKQDYKNLVQQHATCPRPRDINLVS